MPGGQNLRKHGGTDVVLITRTSIGERVAKAISEEIELRTIPVKSLVLDPDNPRFVDLKILKGKGKPSDEDLMEEISKDREISGLTKAIRSSGVRNPIWVKALKDARYLVIEGNRRTYILRNLLAEKAEPEKPGVRYDIVKAHIYPANTDDTELLLQRVALQAGQKPWLAFNTARTAYELRYLRNLEEEDVATEMQLSQTDVRNKIKNVELLIEYVKATGDADPKHFTYFNDAPKRVKDWIEEDEKNKKLYFKLIRPDPVSGFQRIRSAATKGGLRDFATLLDHPKSLKEFVADEDQTVEEAVGSIKTENILEELPFIKRLGTIAAQLNSLSEDQIEKLNSEGGVIKNLKRLKRATMNILKKLGQDDAS